MKFAHPDIDTVFDTENGCYNTLVVENQQFLADLIQALYGQIRGEDGSLVISVRDEPVPVSRHVAILDRFVPFDINQKLLLNRIVSALSDTIFHLKQLIIQLRAVMLLTISVVK